MDRMKKLKEKKGEHSKMHPLERKAKMGVVHDMQKMAHDAMGDKLKGLSKVSVASDSPEGLEHGLDHAKSMLHNLPEALDDSHHDHENFAHTENSKDGEDGESDFPDADDGHELNANPMAEHRKDEEAEGDEHAMAEGGEVEEDVEDHEDEEQREEHSEMPNYDDMDAGEMSAHLNELVAALKKKGLA